MPPLDRITPATTYHGFARQCTNKGTTMETLITMILIAGAGFYLYRQGKRLGSRSGFGAACRQRRFRRHR